MIIHRPSQRDVGGRQANVSGWSRSQQASEGKRHFAHEHDAVTALGHDVHCRIDGLDIGGRQSSVSGWSRKHIPHGVSSDMEHKPIRKIFPTNESMAANNESSEGKQGEERRHYQDEARSCSGTYSERNNLGYMHQRRHVPEPATAASYRHEKSLYQEPPVPRHPAASTSPPKHSPGQHEKCLGAMPESGYAATQADLAALAKGEVFAHQRPTLSPLRH